MAGFATAEYATAEAALAADVAAVANCLVLDVHLPGRSGVALWESLGARGARPPAVFITAFDDAALHRRIADPGCCCLIKPFAGEALVQAIEGIAR